MKNVAYPLQLEHRENERLTEFGSLLKWVRLGELGTAKDFERLKIRYELEHEKLFVLTY